ncbi:hypothetical protein F1B92_06265 [Campylobacter sp. FMV-PI01]|uniref:Uncharacterized protein n=1 Tax=Campylobacter portucalensis TaxID=2608384 RepID=A0A6L5WKJ4_9BACT|nr:hypothetical protein [Campylobacter portucalensis]MSN96767.1 hypothetical protein [Campylobacter portucalensis]
MTREEIEKQEDIEEKVDEIKGIIDNAIKNFKSERYNFFIPYIELIDRSLIDMLEPVFNKKLFCYEDIRAFKSLLITNRSLFKSCIEQLEKTLPELPLVLLIYLEKLLSYY